MCERMTVERVVAALKAIAVENHGVRSWCRWSDLGLAGSAQSISNALQHAHRRGLIDKRLEKGGQRWVWRLLVL